MVLGHENRKNCTYVPLSGSKSQRMAQGIGFGIVTPSMTAFPVYAATPFKPVTKLCCLAPCDRRFVIIPVALLAIPAKPARRLKLRRADTKGLLPVNLGISLDEIRLRSSQRRSSVDSPSSIVSARFPNRCNLDGSRGTWCASCPMFLLHTAAPEVLAAAVLEVFEALATKRLCSRGAAVRTSSPQTVPARVVRSAHRLKLMLIFMTTEIENLHAIRNGTWVSTLNSNRLFPFLLIG